MAIIRRQDGTQFVLQPYREIIDTIKPGLLKSHVRLLSQANGDYACLLKKANKSFEAVIAKEGGHLLGETVWLHLGKPDNLVYCEALSDKRCLLVVVKEGNVYVDNALPVIDVRQELSSLITDRVKYTVIVHGQVPLTNNPEEKGKFVFADHQIETITYSETSVFENLPTNNELKLELREQALKNLSLNLPISPLKAIAASVLIVGLLLWFLWPEKDNFSNVVEKDIVDPYAGYYQALSTADPATMLTELSMLVVRLYELPGWEVKNIAFASNSYQVAAVSAGGTLTQLRKWTLEHDIPMKMQAGDVLLTFSSQLASRERPTSIVNMDELVTILVDEAPFILLDGSLRIGSTRSYNTYREQNLSLQLSGVSPEILLLVANQVANLPLTLANYTVTISNGLVSGNLQLKALGT